MLARTGLSGGIKSNRLLAEAMVRRGHEVTIAYLENGRPWPKPWRVRDFLKRMDLELQVRRGMPHHLEQSTTRLVPVKGNRVRPEDVPDADVTIGTWWETMEWIADWPESKGLKAYFVRHHEVALDGRQDRVAATYRMPALKLVIARWLQRVMAEEYGDANCVLVPNGIDWEQFDSTPRGKQSVPTVGVMYRSDPWKGMATAFEAIRLAQETVPELRVIAFGPHPVQGAHPANFEYHLAPAQSKIPDLYRATDCWLMPSTTEGFGMPGLESAACRCPIVATRCGGPEDYVDDGHNGFLVDVGDAAGMADRILRVVRNDDIAWRAMSEASYAVARRFDWDQSAGLLEAALLKAVAERREPATAGLHR